MTEKANRKQQDLNGGRLVTDEDFKSFEAYVRKETERVRDNPELASKQLYRTGMYDKQGRLKPEFNV